MSRRPAPSRLQRFVVEALEPRLLYSADVGPSLLGAVVSPVAEQRLVESDPLPAQPQAATQTQAREVVFVDAATPDADRLIADIQAQPGRTIDVVRIGADEDGLARIGTELAARQDVSAVHIISHGSDGAVRLGATTLDSETLQARGSELAAWSASLSQDADVLIYGCDVAQDTAGQAFLQQLAKLTGADVAASTNLTGSAVLGGDWNLEYSTGTIEAHLALTQQAQRDWLGLLPVADVAASQDTYIESKAPNDTKNFGTSTSLVADRESTDLQRVLVQFDLSAIPPNATINSATLQMQATQIGGALNIDVYQVQESWSEGLKDGGVDAASWIEREVGTPWTTAGGTFDSTPVASINTNAVGQHSWDVTSLVQAWVNGSKTNNGFMIGSPDGGGNRTVTYDSRETVGGTAPVLVIDYTVNPNTAPTLDTTKAPQLDPLNEDAGAPSGAVGTLVSSLVDFASPAGQVDNVTDPDPGAKLGVAVTGANAANGTWWYTTNGGSTWNGLGAVSDASARLLAADANTRIYFQPNANFNGSVSPALTFRAWDQTTGVNGGTANTASASFTVSDTFTTASYSNNDGTASWSTSWVDADGNPAAGNIRVTGGELVLSTFLGTESVYRQVDLSGASGASLSFSYNNQLGLLGTVSLQASNDGGATYSTLGTFSSGANTGTGTYTADLGAYMASGTRIRFEMSGTLLGGSFHVDNVQVAYTKPLSGGTTAFSASTASSSIAVASVNDAPAGVSNTVTTLEDTAYVFSAGDFGFSDSDGNTFAGVKIAALPAAGSLTNKGIAVAAGQTVSAADIAAGYLSFIAAPNANGTAYAAFTFQVQDNGGTANGGVDLDPVARTMTVNVTAVNDAPAGVNNTVTTLEDTPYVFAATDFGFSDSDGNAFAGVKIAALPVAGTLTNNGVAVTAGQTVSAADVVAGLLRFTPAPNANGAGYATFSFQVQDNGGAANGGVDLDPVARAMTVNVTPVNDAPAGASNTVTTLEDTAYVFSAGDFGFGDSDGNAFAGVKIAALPAAGSLTNNGVAVTAGQTVSAADIAAGHLSFIAAPNANGTAYAAFTFQVQDDGGTANGGADLDPIARTMTVNVTPVNDAPIGKNVGVTTLEDTAYVFASTDFGFSDPDGNSLLAVRIASLPTAGTLTDNGVAVSLGQQVSAADLAAGLVRFTPAANANGAGYASFKFQVRDNGGTANGGVDFDPAVRTMTVDVTPVNDAPSGANNTVTTLEDTPYVFATADFGFTDLDGGVLTAVDIASLPASGALTDNGVAVASGQWVSATDIAAGLLRFTPAANANGAGYASFTFQVRDDGGTANGGVAVDPTARTMTVNVTPVNDAPAAANNIVTTLEDTAYIFAAGDFGFSDTDGNALAAVKIGALPGAGALTDNGVAVTVDQTVSAADIAAGLLRFAPAPNANGAGYASFTFQVQDNGGTANGGVDVDPTARTMTVNVTAVNDAPAAASNTVTTLEDTAYVFAAGDFGYSDTDGNALAAVKIDSLPGAGTLTNNGVAVSSGQLVSASDIAAGLLRFTPAANASGAGYASFTFQVQDDGGTANGGVDLDPTARTMTVNVTAVNDAPSGANQAVTTLEDTAYMFAATDFGFSDADGNALAAVKIATLPGAGTLTDNGVAVSAGQLVSAADIGAGLLRFTPTANANGAGYASFTFQVQDDGGTANGGVNLDPTARTMTVNVTAVNDAPSGTNNAVTTLEDTAYVFAASDFGFSDAEGNAFAAVKIGTLPGAGTLTDNGVAVTAGQFISSADIAGGLLRFTPVPNANGAGYASFAFQVQDNGGTANGGVDLDPTARTMTVNVAAVNDAPTGVNKTVTMVEDGVHVFAAADFGFSDADGNALAAVKIGALPGAGTLTDNGVAVTAGQSVPAADIAAGLLRFTPAPNANGAGYASFTFQVQDDGGTANGGVDLDPTARTMTVDVTAVNDAPSGTSNTVAMLEDGAYVFAAADFGFSDADGNALAGVKIAAVPAAGALTDNGVAVTAGQVVSAADIAAGLLRFTPAANANGAGYATFAFQVQDNGGTANGGTDLDPIARTMRVDVASVNDAPTGTNNAVLVQQDGTYAFSAADFGFSDSDGNAFAGVVIGAVPPGGLITDNGVPVAAGQTVSAGDIAAGLVRYTPALGASGMPYASFTFRVQDSGGTANGGVDTDAVARTMTINVMTAPSPGPLVGPVPVPAPPPQVQSQPPAPAAPAATNASAPALTEQTAPAAASARLLLASNDVLGTRVDVDEGFRFQTIAAQPLASVFATTQRLTNFTPASSPAFGSAGSASVSDEKQFEFQLFGSMQVSDRAGGGSGSRAAGLAGDLDRMRDDLGEQGDFHHWVSGSIAVGSFGLTVGYVLWLLRGGALLASLLSSLPAWRLIDPLPVLSRVDEEEDEEEDQDAFVSFEEANLPFHATPERS